MRAIAPDLDVRVRLGRSQPGMCNDLDSIREACAEALTGAACTRLPAGQRDQRIGRLDAAARAAAPGDAGGAPRRPVEAARHRGGFLPSGYRNEKQEADVKDTSASPNRDKRDSVAGGERQEGRKDVDRDDVLRSRRGARMDKPS